MLICLYFKHISNYAQIAMTRDSEFLDALIYSIIRFACTRKENTGIYSVIMTPRDFPRGALCQMCAQI
jgi:hypothetical protein